MITDVYFAKKNNKLLIAYQNAREQNVYLSISDYKFAPKLEKSLILHNDYNIDFIIEKGFEYTKIEKKEMDIGVKYKNIWKPFLDRNVMSELNFDISMLYKSKRNLYILVQKLQDLLLYVEPTETSLKTYSHKIKELFILACTEVESYFKLYGFGRNERTSDYIKILKRVNLFQYNISLFGYTNPYSCNPFKCWNEDNPTQSLFWYDAFTKLKHNPTDNFNLATLENCINAIAADIILFTIRYSVHSLYRGNDIYSTLISSLISLKIEETFDFYIPNIESKANFLYPEEPYQFCVDNKYITATNLCGEQILIPFIER